MAIKKNKIHIIEKITSLHSSIKEYEEEGYWWDDDYDWWHEEQSDLSTLNEYATYEYLPEEPEKKSYIHKYRSSWYMSLENVKQGRMIDMNTIYSKETLRHKRIDEILGIGKPISRKTTTIGDIWSPNI